MDKKRQNKFYVAMKATLPDELRNLRYVAYDNFLKSHLTLMESFDIPRGKCKLNKHGKYMVKFDRLCLFGEDNTILVACVKSKGLKERHDEIKTKCNVRFAYPKYSPHITLGEVTNKFNLKKANEIVYRRQVPPIVVWQEFTEQ